MDVFEIVLEGVNGYSVGKFWEDKNAEIYASRGASTCSLGHQVCVLSWSPNGIYIVGGPKFMKRVTDCDRNTELLKELCWKVVLENMTIKMLQDAMKSKFDSGVTFGDQRRLEKIREALEINS